jgi:spermidine dehydrogenase
MTIRKREREHTQLGLDRDITRRDFIGSTLIGSGAALLAATAPGFVRPASAQTMAVPLTGLGPDWTGPGGVGDYARANGNTHEVVNASHAVRNSDYAARLRAASDTGETYDLVIVGAGFAGLASAYRWHKERPDESVLIFDVHPIFGG